MSGSRLATDWGTSAMPRPRSATREAASMGAPSNQMRPRTRALGSNSPRPASASRVLPEPEAPTTARISPSWTDRLREWITSTSRWGAAR